MLQVCTAWSGLRHREDLWRSLIVARLSTWSMPRRPRKSWHAIYFERRCIGRRQWKYRHEILLVSLAGKKPGKAQYGPLRTDSVAGLRKLLRELGDDLDVNFVSDVSGNHILNLAAKCGATRCVCFCMLRLLHDVCSLCSDSVGYILKYMIHYWRIQYSRVQLHTNRLFV
jgi:hypothetical protein